MADKIIARECPRCNESFETVYADKVYCSKRCKTKAKAQRHFHRKALLIRKDAATSCKECGVMFTPLHSGRQFCDKFCQQAYKYRNRVYIPKPSIRSCLVCSSDFPSDQGVTYQLCSSECQDVRLNQIRRKALPLVKTCRQCGDEFQTTTRTRSKVYCSTKCKKDFAYVSKQTANEKPISIKEKECQHCGNTYIGRANKYCSDVCGVEAREQAREADDNGYRFTCQSCGKEDTANRRGRVRCDECKRSPDPIECQHCGDTFQPNMKGQRFCSQSCRSKQRYANRSIQTTINSRIRIRMGESIKSGVTDESKAGRTWSSLVGYSITDLKRHIERQFIDGMSWQRFMDGDIHVDHIIPLASFDIQSIGDSEFNSAWCLSNLRPLWAEDNIKKGSRLESLV